MDSFVGTYIGAIRYIIPILAFVVLLRCVVSLFRNRPRIHKMAQLVNQEDGTIIDIDHWETSIGRSKSNDIVLEQPTVSRFHAVVAKKKSDWVVTDTFSKSGVKINGDKVDKKGELEDGDVISIGGVSLIFQCAEAISQQKRDQMRSSAKNQNVAFAVLVDTATKRPVYIKKHDVLIGRGEECDLRIPSEMVSGEHARIHETSRGWALSDLDSHNGTKLNGRYITEPLLIFDGDMITFGDRVFMFYDK